MLAFTVECTSQKCKSFPRKLPELYVGTSSVLKAIKALRDKDSLLKAALEGAEVSLNQLDKVTPCFPETVPERKVPEEQFMRPQVDEEMEHPQANWSDNEIPMEKREEILAEVPKEVRQSVRRAHRGLGHPSKSLFLKATSAEWLSS